MRARRVILEPFPRGPEDCGTGYRLPLSPDVKAPTDNRSCALRPRSALTDYLTKLVRI